MKLIVDIPNSYNLDGIRNGSIYGQLVLNAVKNGTPIPDNATNGKEVLIKYCLEHSGEEIYNFLRWLFDESMNWTDSRGFIIEWLERGNKNDK